MMTALSRSGNFTSLASGRYDRRRHGLKRYAPAHIFNGGGMSSLVVVSLHATNLDISIGHTVSVITLVSMMV